jgi:flagellar hook-length control protein FliK
MDAITFTMRPLPQALPAQPAPAPAAKPHESSMRADDARPFKPTAPKDRSPSDATRTPARKAAQAAPSDTTEADKAPTDPNKSKPEKTQPGDKPDADAPKDTAANSDQKVGSTIADGAALLAAQAASTATPTPIATPTAAPLPVMAAETATTVTKQPDAATTIQTTAGKARTAAVSTIPPQPQRTATAEQHGVEQAPSNSKSDAARPQVPHDVAATAAKTSAATTDGSAAAKPQVLTSLLNGASAQNATQPAATPPTQTPQAPNPTTETQQIAPQAAQITQLAAATASDATSNNADKAKADIDRPAPTHAAADTPTAPAISFGTDPGSSTHVKTATAAYEAARAAAPVVPASEQVAMQIHRAIEDGVDKLTVELKPASLGRVSAEIQFQNDHRVHVVLSADRPATLDALRSDSRALERALQDAGLRADAGSLSFRFDNSGGQPGFQPDGGSSAIAAAPAPSTTETAPATLTAYAAMTRPGGIDIRV